MPTVKLFLEKNILNVLILLCFIITGRELELLCAHKEVFKFIMLSLLFLNNGSNSALNKTVKYCHRQNSHSIQ